MNGRSPASCLALNDRAATTKVIIPILQSWVKERNDFVGLWGDATEIGAFVKIAAGARQTKIIVGVVDAMLLGDDVINGKIENGSCS